MTKLASTEISRESLIVLAFDEKRADGALSRSYRVGRGPDVAAPSRFTAWKGRGTLPLEPALGGSIFVFLAPTRTYSEGFGSDGTSALAPEDRAMIRSLRRRSARVVCASLNAQFHASDSLADKPQPRSLISFEWKYLRNAKEIFKSSMTRPNRQDYIYLATKTFGLNLVVRVAFAAKAIVNHQVPTPRAVAVTCWYQLQDIVFTVFGQTYMKFLGKMTGLLRVGRAQLGDFFFVYFQLVGFEFLNRLVLGPIGENPLVYSWQGLSLIFLNILQGLISGGPLTPAINQLRRVGVISHSTLMHLYQLGGLTLQFGLFATFGYQKIYAGLTGSVLVLSWSSYAIATFCFPEPELLAVDDAALSARLGQLLQQLPDLA